MSERISVVDGPPMGWVDGRSGRRFGGGYITVQCSSDLFGNDVVCPNEAHIKKPVLMGWEEITDAMATKAFKSAGWSVSPTMCPVCKKKYGVAKARALLEGE